MQINKRFVAAGAGTLVAAGLVLAAALPAQAADVQAPTAQAGATTSSNVIAPVPVATGLRVLGGQTKVIGTATPGALVVVTVGDVGAVDFASTDGAFEVPLIGYPVASFDISTRTGGTSSDSVHYRIVDGKPVAGESAPAEKPVVTGFEKDPDRVWLTGTGQPGAQLQVRLAPRVWTTTTVGADGAFRASAGIHRSGDFTYEVRQGKAGNYSDSVFITVP